LGTDAWPCDGIEARFASLTGWIGGATGAIGASAASAMTSIGDGRLNFCDKCGVMGCEGGRNTSCMSDLGGYAGQAFERLYKVQY
jgi:hypothetical protein